MTTKNELHPKYFVLDEGSGEDTFQFIVSEKVGSKLKDLDFADRFSQTVVATDDTGASYAIPMGFDVVKATMIKDKPIRDFFVRNFGPAKMAGKVEKGYVAIPDYEIRNTLNVNYETELKGYLIVDPEMTEADLMKNKPETPALRTVAYREAEKNSSYLPAGRSDFVPFGIYDDLVTVLSTGFFFPVYVTGLSGNGKTMTIGEVCRKMNREMIRANITSDTDEDDLIGHYELVDGETVWHEGPVVTAMKRGAVLLLDEVDLGTNRMMCLQPVLEGNPILIKKTGEYVVPVPGFTVVATANTKGKGDDTGNFTGTNVLNEAFLDRFPITLHQVYPPREVEFDILQKVAGETVAKVEPCDAIFFENMINWANKIRDGFEKTEYDDVITTRRLVNAVKLFYMYDRNEDFVIGTTVQRFDAECADAFKSAYNVIRKPLYHDPDQDRHEGSRDPKVRIYKKNAEGNYVA